MAHYAWMSRWRALSLGVLVTIVAFAGITMIALEGNEVVVLHTRREDGSMRATRVWIADENDSELVEAATTDRGFYIDLLREPALELERHGEMRSRRATILPNPDGHRRIREMLRQRYGWADRWIGMLTDTSQSVAVRLHRPKLSR